MGIYIWTVDNCFSLVARMMNIRKTRVFERFDRMRKARPALTKKRSAAEDWYDDLSVCKQPVVCNQILWSDLYSPQTVVRLFLFKMPFSYSCLSVTSLLYLLSF